ncbi:MAG: hypothetical protein ACRDOO_22175 [Actinomadura sp.]
MDDRRPIDRPREADAADHVSTESRTRLVALSERLKAQFDVELTGEGLVVHHRDLPGVVVTVVCRRRSDDGGRWWYLASCGEPIAEADWIPDAVVAISGHLSRWRS